MVEDGKLIKECEDAIKHLTWLLNNCPNGIKGCYLNFERGILREILENVINKLRRLNPQNVLFQKK